MAGGHVKYRHLSRHSAHRKALLRNLVTSLIDKESIHTTWPKAKEAQRLAEKVITLGKKNTEASKRVAIQTLFRPYELVPKLFGELRLRYAQRPGGYTRVLRTEPKKEDQAPSAILELVDGPKDMRFHITAQTLVHMRRMKEESQVVPPVMWEATEANVKKVTRYRHRGKAALMELVDRFEKMEVNGEKGERDGTKKERVYPDGRDEQFYRKKSKEERIQEI